MTENETQPVEIPDAAADAQQPLKPRIGTIVWGSILLVVAAIAIFAAQVDLGELTPTVIVWSVVGFGAVLVIVGLVAGIVRAATKER
ncbi:fatty acid desaturase [Conyzicola lurida]|uniref:Fatty acid desaturase n=1 Tax=Conyzicola lurida TaxID=1172621 RepID=A0A841AMW2_9MICO|nr:hypothetical protein [Conyzicola lurida]MBB5844527.1 fatty acid desaturase [Conyzicola lurida]